MTKEEIIHILEGMGFKLDYDQWDVKSKKWIRFILKEELDEPDLRLIWYKEVNDYSNFSEAASILFKAGQKAKILQFSQYITL